MYPEISALQIVFKPNASKNRKNIRIQSYKNVIYFMRKIIVLLYFFFARVYFAYKMTEVFNVDLFS